VRHVVEPIAVVIAETSAQAIEAAEAVSVEYASLPAVVDARAAMQAPAPQLHEAAPQNVCFRWSRGDKLAVEQQLRSANHVTSVELINNRLVGAAIEPRAVLAVPAGDGLILYSSTQVPHHIRRLVTEQLGMAQNAIRVIAPDVGGGFGYKGKHYPEEVVLAWAARGQQRPVKWVASRSESFISDYQGRDLVSDEHAGQVVGLCLCRECPHEAQRARAEDRRQDARARLGGASDLDATIERVMVRHRGWLHRTPEDRVRAQGREHLAGHEGLEVHDTAILDADPLGVGAG
jgi:hypothetical protein